MLGLFLLYMVPVSLYCLCVCFSSSCCCFSCCYVAVVHLKALDESSHGCSSSSSSAFDGCSNVQTDKHDEDDDQWPIHTAGCWCLLSAAVFSVGLTQGSALQDVGIVGVQAYISESMQLIFLRRVQGRQRTVLRSEIVVVCSMLELQQSILIWIMSTMIVQALFCIFNHIFCLLVCLCIFRKDNACCGCSFSSPAFNSLSPFSLLWLPQWARCSLHAKSEMWREKWQVTLLVSDKCVSLFWSRDLQSRWEARRDDTGPEHPLQWEEINYPSSYSLDQYPEVAADPGG